MAEHSPEPWTIFNSGESGRGCDSYCIEAAGTSGAVVLDCDEADARRIVACVNACKGVPTEALESGAISIVPFGA